MNKRIMNGLLLASLLTQQYQYAENVSCKEKVKNAVSALCKRMPSKKTCLIALSAIASTAVTIGVLLKYTDVLSKIFAKNGTEKPVENNTDTNSEQSQDGIDGQSNNQDKKQNENQEDSQKSNTDEVKILPVDEKKSVEAKGFFESCREFVSKVFDNQAI